MMPVNFGKLVLHKLKYEQYDISKKLWYTTFLKRCDIRHPYLEIPMVFHYTVYSLGNPYTHRYHIDNKTNKLKQSPILSDLVRYPD